MYHFEGYLWLEKIHVTAMLKMCSQASNKDKVGLQVEDSCLQLYIA